MAVSGKRKEFTGYSPKLGFFQATVIAFNPTLEEINEFQDISNMKEPDYNGKDWEDKNDDNKAYKQAGVTIYFKFHDGSVQSKRFNIIQKVRYSKEGNIQYINSLGNLTWALPDDVEETNEKKSKHITNEKYAWFTKREFRPAYIGEQQLYEFLQKWLSLDWKDPDTMLSLDPEKFFKGNYKELQGLLKEEAFKDGTVVGYSTIHTTVQAPSDEHPDGQVKHYQAIYDKFLPGNAWRYLNVSAMQNPMPLYKYTLPAWIQDFVNEMTGEYGSKDYLGKIEDNKLQICELRDFSNDESPIVSASSIHTDGAGSSNNANFNPNPETVDDLPF